MMADGQAWPCANLSLSVGSFEDGVGKNKAIEGFLVRADQAKSLIHARPRDTGTSSEQPSTEKKRKIDEGIKRFFNQPHADDSATSENESPQLPLAQDLAPIIQADIAKSPDTSQIQQFTCSRCSKSIPEYDREEHDDWHFAKDLANQDRQEVRDAQQQSATLTNSRASNTRGRGGRGRGKSEKGQMRLAF
jgi:DNA polymerase eta